MSLLLLKEKSFHEKKTATCRFRDFCPHCFVCEKIVRTKRKKVLGPISTQKTTCFRANYFQKRKEKLLWREILVFRGIFFRETGTQKTFQNSIYCDFSLAIMYIHFMVDHKICQNCFRRQRYQAFLKATFRSWNIGPSDIVSWSVFIFWFMLMTQF